MPGRFMERANRALVKRMPGHLVDSRLTRPIASFSFDDFPVSALETGASILEARGVRGTFYASGSLSGTTYRDLPHFSPDHLRDAAERGHEIGCHAFDHLHYHIEGAERLAESMDRNAAFFAEHLGDLRPASFAYPFGETSWSVKRYVAQRFPIARGVRFGVNRGAMDFAQLRATPFDLRWRHKVDVPAFIDEARRSNGWLIFFTHDVQEDPSLEGCAPDDLKRALDLVLELGFDVLPIKSAASRVKFG
jgi:peptidoglycan/xylan/chitin deacetylase (PgdA/CDA1 family)